MNEEEKKAILKKYLSGSCTPEERKLVDEWCDLSYNQSLPFSDENKARLEFEMLQNIHKKTVPALSNHQRRLPNWLKGAAAIFLLLGMGYLFVHHKQKSVKTKEQETPDLFSFQTKAGQRARVMLPDSSVMWLNSATAIRYEQQFSGESREVYLDSGEAFFEVKPLESKPFVVHTKSMSTHVLGTSFNIQTKDHNNTLLLSVSTGKVRVGDIRSDPAASEILEAGQQFSYRLGNGTYKLGSVDPAQTFAWKDNLLVFENASWEEIKNRLDSWFGVNVKLMLSKKSEESFTAKFENPSLDQVLNALGRINEFDYEIKKKEVIIKD